MSPSFEPATIEVAAVDGIGAGVVVVVAGSSGDGVDGEKTACGGVWTNRELRRCAHRSVLELEADVRRWINEWNKNPKPFVWTKTADQILDTLAAYCQRINDSGHRRESNRTAPRSPADSRPAAEGTR
jgi:hypothetical protein